MIYALEHTNIYLSGQIKIDIALRNTGDKLEAYDLKVTPLSDTIPFAFDKEYKYLHYSHGYNIAQLHSQLGELFYNRLDKFTSDYFISDNLNGAPVIPYDTQTEAGIKRIPMYKYGTQFQLFAPVWVDYKMGETPFTTAIEGYRFAIGMNMEDEFASDNTTTQQYFSVEFSPEIEDYLNSFLRNCNPTVLYADLEKYYAYSQGINVETGEFVKVDCSNLIENLRDRERPLIEQNYMIGECFKSNKIVVPNLMNFNFIIDETDILQKNFPNKSANVIRFTPKFRIIRLNNALSDDNDIIPMYDFLFNHKDLPKIETTSEIHYEKGGNLFVEKNEDRVYGLFYKNKMNPYICHWSQQLLKPVLFNTYSPYSTESGMPPLASDFSSDEPNMGGMNFVKVVNCTTIFGSSDYPAYAFLAGKVGSIQDMYNLPELQYAYGSDKLFTFENIIQEGYMATIEKGEDIIINGVNFGKWEEKTFSIIYISVDEGKESDNLIVNYLPHSGNPYEISNDVLLIACPADKKNNDGGIVGSAKSIYKKLLEMEDEYKIAEKFFKILTSVDKRYLYKLSLDKTFTTKLHKCEKSSDPEDPYISYDLYKCDNANLQMVRTQGRLYPLLIQTEGGGEYSKLCFNLYYRKKFLETDIDADLVSENYKKKIFPYYMEYNSLEEMYRHEYIKTIKADGIEAPCVGRGVCYNLDHSWTETISKDAKNNSYGKEHPITKEEIWMLVDEHYVEKIDNEKAKIPYSEIYKYTIIDLNEILENKDGKITIKYEYTIKFELI